MAEMRTGDLRQIQHVACVLIAQDKAAVAKQVASTPASVTVGTEASTAAKSVPGGSERQHDGVGDQGAHAGVADICATPGQALGTQVRGASETVPVAGEGGGDTVVGLSLIHISEPTRRYAISYAVFCLKKKK